VNVNREKKTNRIEELNQVFDKYNTFYLLDFMKMPVEQAVELRRRLREQAYSFKVVKNRLALRALKEDFPDDLKNVFQGPTGIAFAEENPINLARILKDFSDEFKVLKVKGGLVEGQFLSPESFSELASLTSREDLIAKFCYLMALPLVKLSQTWQAPINSLGRLLSQLKSKK